MPIIDIRDMWRVDINIHRRHMGMIFQHFMLEGMTMVIVTHEMGFAREVANKVIFIDDGMILEEESPKEFFENPKNPRLQEFLSKVLA